MQYPQTPELDKMSKVKEESQKIGEFLDWLQNTKRITLAQWAAAIADEDDDEQDRLVAIRQSIEDLLADYFKIDQVKAEQERRALLEYVQEQAAKGKGK